MIEQRKLLWIATAAVASAMSACGGSSGTTGASVGGTVAGLPNGATVQLADNSSTLLAVTGNGNFAFPAAVPAGASYDVTISSQPAGSTCAVADGTGAADVNADPVTNVAVTCTPGVAISGTLTGLSPGASLALADATTTLPLTANGPFMLSDLYAPGTPYAVRVASQPTGQVCSVSFGAGTIDAAGDAPASLAVSCVPVASLGGTVTGLAAGQTVTLNDGLSNNVVTANGAFGFGDAFAAGAQYAVVVASQPSAEVCTVSANASGAIDGNGDPVTSIAVSCANDGTVGGTVSGLTAGNTVTLSDGISTLSISGNGSLAFVDVFAAGAPYAVSVTTQPIGQTCSITNSNGSFDAGDDPVAVSVMCL